MTNIVSRSRVCRVQDDDGHTFMKLKVSNHK